jgi:hypothetical protein
MIARAIDVEFMEKELPGRFCSRWGDVKRLLTMVPAMVSLQGEKTPPEQSWLNVRDAAGEKN